MLKFFFDPVWWRNTLVNAVIGAIVFIVVVIIVGILGEPIFDRPPISVVSSEPEHLGVLCPGEFHYIHNEITIDEPVVALYYVSVMDEKRLVNILGTQIVYSGIQHPVPGTFQHNIEWVVPALRPGEYSRNFAARGTDTSEKTVFVYNYFTIGKDCPHEKPSTSHRSPQDFGSGDHSLVGADASVADDR